MRTHLLVVPPSVLTSGTDAFREVVMRLAVMSDLHLEFETAPARGRNRHLPCLREEAPAVDADLVLLAGDIHTKARSAAWAARSFQVPVVMVGGNHHGWGDYLFASIAKERRAAAKCGSFPCGTPRVTVLEREIFVHEKDGERVRIVGATMWTDFALFGEGLRPMIQARAGREMNDYARIKMREFGPWRETRRLEPDDTARIHAMSVQFIREALARDFDGKTVVMTHHAPSPRSIAPKYAADQMSAAYASDLERLIGTFQPTLWVHGHIHDSADYRLGDTRIVCNPRGYFPSDMNPAFVWGKVIEI